jgi:transposase
MIYPSNLTDEEWTVIEPLIPPARRGGRQRSTDRRVAMNCIMNVLTSGCQWRSIPSDPLPRATVVHYFSLWRLATPVGMVPMLQTMLADRGDAGLIFRARNKKLLPRLNIEIIRRSDAAKGFEALPRRWIVERTIAWLNRCCRLANNWKNLNCNAVAFLKTRVHPDNTEKALQCLNLFRTDPKAAPG